MMLLALPTAYALQHLALLAACWAVWRCMLALEGVA
jgi:hypothetical protein